MSKHTEITALGSLKNKQDVSLDLSTRTIYMLTNDIWNPEKGIFQRNPKKQFDIGNKSLGKIDFLTTKCGWVLVSVQELPKVKRRETNG